ncbi:hypothetical protein U8326_10080 [Tsuneonella sp. CC-YZS046]|uniref:hypothetical protein n=1 Tax=Tsuneonella sp. CC-YZS046 TaxID=3042152 RepID=UPI002D7775F2|nr:hypothetical protein [Tsuneonella sp. CC-YZS046]WRO65409.1 hypothetical protein U8326_10080 [Tsuneonella sp. CC-YZS046]
MNPCPTDSAILVAFDEWRKALLAYRALPDAEEDRVEDEHGYTEEEKTLWDKIHGAEKLIVESPAKTPAGVSAKLLIALVHIDGYRETETTVISDDINAVLALDESLDGNGRIILAAIRSLQGMEAQL